MGKPVYNRRTGNNTKRNQQDEDVPTCTHMKIDATWIASGASFPATTLASSLDDFQRWKNATPVYKAKEISKSGNKPCPATMLLVTMQCTNQRRPEFFISTYKILPRPTAHLLPVCADAPMYCQRIPVSLPAAKTIPLAKSSFLIFRFIDQTIINRFQFRHRCTSKYHKTKVARPPFGVHDPAREMPNHLLVKIVMLTRPASQFKHTVGNNVAHRNVMRAIIL